jgi:hypothetical protein
MASCATKLTMLTVLKLRANDKTANNLLSSREFQCVDTGNSCVTPSLGASRNPDQQKTEQIHGSTLCFALAVPCHAVHPGSSINCFGLLRMLTVLKLLAHYRTSNNVLPSCELQCVNTENSGVTPGSSRDPDQQKIVLNQHYGLHLQCLEPRLFHK